MSPNRLLALTVGVLIAVSTFATAASANEWRYNPDRGGPGGLAVTTGERNSRFLINCGPGGIVQFLFRRTNLTGTMAAVVAVDGARTQGRLECEGVQCRFSPSTVAEALALAQALRRGDRARLRAAGSAVDTYSLRGSAAAIERLRTVGGCEV